MLKVTGAGGWLSKPTSEEGVLRVDPLASPVWRHLVTNTRSDVFHSPEWLSVIAETYGLKPVATVLLDADGQPRGGVPYVEIDDFLGLRTSTLPFSDFTDPFVDSQDDWKHLADDIAHDGAPWTLRCLHASQPASDARFEVTGEAAWHRIDTSRHPDEIWESIDSGARRATRKATKSGLTIAPATDKAELRAFFELHRGLRRHKYGLLAQPYSFFEAIWDHFIEPGQGVLLLARSGDVVAGGVLFLQWGDTLYYKFNASNPDHLNGRPNDLILWNGIVHAHENGLAWVDMGVSDLDQPGLVAYKRKYSTEEGIVRTVRQPVGWVPSSATEQGRQTLTRLTELFVGPGVDDAVTEQAGDELYRYFT